MVAGSIFLILVWLDEVNFTKRSISMREYSGRNSNLSIDQREIHVGYRSVIASMTEAEGISMCRIYDHAIDAKDYPKTPKPRDDRMFKCRS